MNDAKPWWVLFDWGGTLMSEEGPADIPMALWPEVHAIEGARETLEQLAPLCRMGIVTNASISRRNMIEIALGRVGLRDFFAEIFCYTDLGVRKEDAAFWRAVLARLGSAPSRVLVVGDNIEPDVLAPRELGISSVWFNAAGADVACRHPVITRLPELVEIVRQLKGERASQRGA